ncbi:hypothetical protein SAMN05428961_11469 [Paenibacillus sp. OK060]|uniref:DUF6973 domain-containing protein n=1 Tax=Paenibacillus sp. OK060 TaxID=1881034 RepID=UPI000885044E|nr:hypothetical protein [Paenibacillus sp. OK060]SDM34154.1 hypothetical protein SAMN05428961_11469 [Paenibacillus sp. OK060]
MYTKKLLKVVSISAMSLMLLIPSVSFANPNTDLNQGTDALHKVQQAAEVSVQNNLQSQSLELNISKASILNEAPAFYESIEGKTYEELSISEQEKFVEISAAATAYYNEISTAVNGKNNSEISPMYFESELSKAIEATIYVGFPTLSTSDIASSIKNANTARDIGVSYAKLNGWGSQTWDNPADAYRHFAWNWLNTKSINANDARVFGDYHELALAAADEANALTSLNYAEKIAWGAGRALSLKSSTQGSLSTFNSVFKNDSIMDIYNNSQGRKYAVNYSHTTVSDAFYAAFFTNNALIGYPTQVTSSVRSTAFSYWQ